VRVPKADGGQNRLTFAVRPEKIRLKSEDTGDINRIKAEISGHVFRGTHHAYEVNLPFMDKSIFVYQQSRSRMDDKIYSVGEQVFVCWNPVESVVLDRGLQ